MMPYCDVIKRISFFKNLLLSNPAEEKLRRITIHAKPHPIIVLLYIQKCCCLLGKKLEQLTMQNYLSLKFPLANLKTFSAARYSWKMF